MSSMWEHRYDELNKENVALSERMKVLVLENADLANANSDLATAAILPDDSVVVEVRHLSNLVAQFTASLHAFEHELRESIGNTNYACMVQAVERFAALKGK